MYVVRVCMWYEYVCGTSMYMVRVCVNHNVYSVHCSDISLIFFLYRTADTILTFILDKLCIAKTSFIAIQYVFQPLVHRMIQKLKIKVSVFLALN